MKKLALIVSLFAFFIFPFESNANTFRDVLVTDQDSVVVKQQENSDSETLATLEKNTFVTVFSKNEEWAHIQVNSINGFVHTAVLKEPQSSIKIANSRSGLVVKELPTTSSTSVATLTYSMVLEDFGPVDDYWSFVQYGNITGYVATSFIGVPPMSTQYTQHDIELRNIASTSGAIVHTLPADTPVTLHATVAGWAYISTDHVKGYTQATSIKPYQVHTASAQSYAPSCAPLTYVNAQNELIHMNCTNQNNQMLWNGTNITDNSAFNHYSVAVQNNALIYTYEGGKEVYPFPIYTGQHWTQHNASNILISYVLDTNASRTINQITYKHLIKIRVTYMKENVVNFIYLAPGIGELLVEDATGKVEWQYKEGN